MLSDTIHDAVQNMLDELGHFDARYYDEIGPIQVEKVLRRLSPLYSIGIDLDVGGSGIPGSDSNLDRITIGEGSEEDIAYKEILLRFENPEAKIPVSRFMTGLLMVIDYLIEDRRGQFITDDQVNEVLKSLAIIHVIGADLGAGAVVSEFEIQGDSWTERTFNEIKKEYDTNYVVK